MFSVAAQYFMKKPLDDYIKEICGQLLTGNAAIGIFNSSSSIIVNAPVIHKNFDGVSVGVVKLKILKF
jgi:hypothetical protein